MTSPLARRPAAPAWWLRATDLGVAAVLAPVWLPLLVLTALSALVVQGRPVLYGAERLGRGGRTFRMLKIRTMLPDADRAGPAVAGRRDARITPLGRLLRRTKLDELPQFLHVLSGEMSIVGPRPESPAYLPYFTDAGRRALAAKPGITGYGAMYFLALEDTATDSFERLYVSSILPERLALDEQGWRELSVAPLRTTVRMVSRTLVVVLRRTPEASA